IGCTTYVRPAAPPPPPPPRTVVVQPPPPDPNWERAEELRRRAHDKRVEAMRHHQDALALVQQANAKQAAADRDFSDGRRLDGESCALLRDRRRVQAEVLWHRAEREERDAALLEARSRENDDAAREEATARDERAAAERLRDAARREDDPAQRRRLEEEARAL